MAPADTLVEELTRGLSPRWISGQRWFRSKRRAIRGLRPIDAAVIDDAGGGFRLGVVAVEFADGGEQPYLLPLVVDSTGAREPADGEGLWRALLGRLARGEPLAGTGGGVFAPEPTAALERLLDGAARDRDGLVERRLGVEQSNTSVALGERLLLKVFRLLEPGVNPDLEMSSFLGEVGFTHTPALAGTLTYRDADGHAFAAAIVSELLHVDGDAWSWMLTSLATPSADGDASAGVTRIGEITAALHAALASHPERPGFGVRTATRRDLAAWHAAALGQLDGAREVLEAGERGRLDALAPRLSKRLDAILAAGGVRVTRVHGDYHLGQLLHRVDGDFAVIDFEGEPARPLDERRQPASPMKDLAGMLRSLDYVARTSARERGTELAAAERRLEEARAAFLHGYGRLSPAESALLAAFEVEKACYEVRYEANNRPDWTWLPLDALERLGR